MAVRKISYCYTTVPNRAGQGEQVLSQLRKANVNLVGYSGFPTKGGKAQLDFATTDIAGVRRVAKKNGWRLSKIKKGFMIQGTDRLGAVHSQIRKLADRKINVTAADAVCAGNGRFGMMLWVRPKDYGRASRALKAR